MTGIRVTQRSLANGVLGGLQNNIARLSQTQNQLSSGKLLSKASDSPGGTVAAMQYRSDITALKQYGRNADDGMGWLSTADSTLTNISSAVHRARDLLLQGKSSGSYGTPQARQAVALEIDNVRDAVIGLANTTYIDRPIFGGTTDKALAFDPVTAEYIGDTGKVERTVGESTKVRADVDAVATFGDGNEQLFKILADISDHMKNDPAALNDDLARLDAASNRVLASVSQVGSRYNQLEQMRQTADDRILGLTTQLSDVEDIDLPKTITDLSLQQTAYQAALSATAKVIQPSLIDFLR